MTRKLHAVPVGLFSFNYDVLEGNSLIGTIENRAAFLQAKGTLKIGQREFFTRREGAFKASYLLESSEGVVLARAVRKRALREEYEISFNDRSIMMRKKALAMKWRFIISTASADIGSIVQESLVSRRLLCELDDEAQEMPLEIVLYLFWIALLIKRSEDSSSA